MSIEQEGTKQHELFSWQRTIPQLFTIAASTIDPFGEGETQKKTWGQEKAYNVRDVALTVASLLAMLVSQWVSCFASHFVR